MSAPRIICNEERFAGHSHMQFRLLLAMILMLLTAYVAFAQTFKWNWRESQELSAGQSLRNSKMAKIEKQLLAMVIADQLRSTMDDSDDASEEQFQKAALDSRIEKVDLNGDGSPEIIVQGMLQCSPTGNCPFLIFQRVIHGYKLLLDGFGQTFTVQRSHKNGFRDVVLGMHGSATESMLTVYRYEGGGYHDVECYEAAWSVLEGDTIRKLKEPRISPCGSQ
jgi:hypothetical protein